MMIPDPNEAEYRQSLNLGPALFFARFMSGAKGPIGIVLQGALIALIGIVIIVANLNNTISIKEITGHVKGGSVLTEPSSFGIVDIAIDTSTDDYAFQGNDVHPLWNEQLFRGQKIDIYYEPETPIKVVALQIYDEHGNPSTKYATGEYDQNPHTYTRPGVSLRWSLTIVAVGLFLMAIGAVLVARRAHLQALPVPERTDGEMMSPYTSPPPKYEPPSRSSHSQ